MTNERNAKNVDSSHNSPADRRPRARFLITLLSILALSLSATSANAQSAGMEAFADGAAQALDAMVIRPLATIRVAVGAVLLVPASLFAAPSGVEGLTDAYEILLADPIDYAFRRELGEL